MLVPDSFCRNGAERRDPSENHPVIRPVEGSVRIERVEFDIRLVKGDRWRSRFSSSCRPCAKYRVDR